MFRARLVEGLRRVVCSALLMVAVASVSQAADARFPFDRELVLDAAPMRPGKRMPGITVSASGAAAIDLWCKSVGGQVEFTDSAIKIAAEPLPEAMPAMQGAGQCTPARVQADEEMLAALSQVTAWRLQGETVVFEGPKPMKFRPATN